MGRGRLIELTPGEQYLYERYTRAAPVTATDHTEGPVPHKVYLTVGNQEFTIGDVYWEDAEHADWLRRMLAKALAQVVLAT